MENCGWTKFYVLHNAAAPGLERKMSSLSNVADSSISRCAIAPTNVHTHIHACMRRLLFMLCILTENCWLFDIGKVQLAKRGHAPFSGQILNFTPRTRFSSSIDCRGEMNPRNETIIAVAHGLYSASTTASSRELSRHRVSVDK